jgi:N-acetylglutamate synthase-like GNAT family acetyltransferase
MTAMGGLLAMRLAVFERDGLKAALVKAGLPADDIGDPHVLFWRFETRANVPAGFGGLEVHNSHALLRSVVTLPPVRRVGMGTAIVGALEIEARALKCSSVYLVTTSAAGFFGRLGYSSCSRQHVPQAIRDSPHFSAPCCASATVMLKNL